MSWDVDLLDESGVVTVPAHSEGGTYALGGTDSASLNVTYNYGRWIREGLDVEQGLKWLHDRKAKHCIERLEAAVGKLGTEKDSNYWAPTAGNAGYALAILLGWAKLHPEAHFQVE